MTWHRVLAKDKLAFREDLQSDHTLTDLQKRMISTIATHWDGGKMHAECSGSFIAVGAGTTEKMVKKYKQTLIDSGRVSVKRAATHSSSTLWDVNWWFRGSAWVRLNNAGEPVLDSRKGGPQACVEGVPTTAHEGGPQECIEGGPQACQGGPQAGTQFQSTDCIGAPSGARPLAGAQGAPKTDGKDNPSRARPGFAKWKIVHAEYTGDEDETFVAHLRSGSSRKFALRCHVDSDDYESINDALGIDGETESIIGEMVQMSTNRSGSKTFMRAAPLPWRDVTILSGETNEDGSAAIRAAFHDDDGREGTLRLAVTDANALANACGGEAEAIGTRVRYRLHPDDTLEFRRNGRTI